MKKPVAVPLGEEAAIVAVCRECGESGTNPIIGALPSNHPPIVYLIHEQVWSGHSQDLGHKVDIVDLRAKPEVVRELHPTGPKPQLLSGLFRK